MAYKDRTIRQNLTTNLLIDIVRAASIPHFSLVLFIRRVTVTIHIALFTLISPVFGEHLLSGSIATLFFFLDLVVKHSRIFVLTITIINHYKTKIYK